MALINAWPENGLAHCGYTVKESDCYCRALRKPCRLHAQNFCSFLSGNRRLMSVRCLAIVPVSRCRALDVVGLGAGARIMRSTVSFYLSWSQGS